MNTRLTDHERLLQARARLNGGEAAAKGQGVEANPHPEDSPLHWEWLDAWCVETIRQPMKSTPPPPFHGLRGLLLLCLLTWLLFAFILHRLLIS